MVTFVCGCAQSQARPDGIQLKRREWECGPKTESKVRASLVMARPSVSLLVVSPRRGPSPCRGTQAVLRLCSGRPSPRATPENPSARRQLGWPTPSCPLWAVHRASSTEKPVCVIPGCFQHFSLPELLRLGQLVSGHSLLNGSCG